MRTTFATVLFVAGTQALTWTEVVDFVKKIDVPALVESTFGVDITQHAAWDFHVTTRADSNATIAKHQRRVKPLTKAQRHQVTEAHHSLMARRDRLGLPRLGAGATPVVGQQQLDFSSLNSFSGFFLNVLAGMSYNGNRNNKCYQAAEDTIVALDTQADILAKIYIPAYWAEAQVNLQDFIAVTSGVYVDCSIDKAFNTATHLITTEGLSELGGRLAGAYPFELSDCLEAYSTPEQFTTAERGTRYGKCISVFLNYTI